MPSSRPRSAVATTAAVQCRLVCLAGASVHVAWLCVVEIIKMCVWSDRLYDSSRESAWLTSFMVEAIKVFVWDEQLCGWSGQNVCLRTLWLKSSKCLLEMSNFMAEIIKLQGVFQKQSLSDWVKKKKAVKNGENNFISYKTCIHSTSLFYIVTIQIQALVILWYQLLQSLIKEWCR